MPRPRPPLLLDGGLSSLLEESHELHCKLWSSALLCPAFLADGPAAVCAAHRRFLDAGADIITTVTYQGTVRGYLDAKLCATAEEAATTLASGVALARRTAASAPAPKHRRPPLASPPDPARAWLPADRAAVAASIGPYGAYLADGSEYRGNYANTTPADLAAFHREKLKSILDNTSPDTTFPDLVAFETLPEEREALAIAEMMRCEFPAQPYYLSFQCRDAAHLASGEPLQQTAQHALTAAGPGLIGLGVNCFSPELAPNLIHELVAAVAAVASSSPQTPTSPSPSTPNLDMLDIFCYPNYGETWDADAKRWRATDVSSTFSSHLAGEVGGWLAAGATVVGGCCRVTPAHIQEMRQILDSRASSSSRGPT